MLDMIDTLIGFSLVMLVVSAAVTVLTGMVVALANLRGVALRRGVTELLALLDRGMSCHEANAIAGHLLRNPLVAKPQLLRGLGLANVVHREELTKLILDFASNGDASKMAQSAGAGGNGGAALDLASLQARLLKSVRGNGIDDPAQTLAQIRQRMLELEQSAPELSNAARVNIAILAVGSSEFLAKINAWFDQTMDRVRDVFTMRVRLISALAALFVAFYLQLDSIGLLNRLSTDGTTRAAIVQEAIKNPQKFQPPAPAPATGGDAAGIVENALRTIQSDPQLGNLIQLGLVNPPASWSAWQAGWRTPASAPPGGIAWAHLAGILISAALLSLGGPFWYDALKNLIGLRSVVARRDDAQRAERQTTQVAAPQDAGASPAGGTTLPPAFQGGERGDPAAVG